MSPIARAASTEKIAKIGSLSLGFDIAEGEDYFPPNRGAGFVNVKLAD